MNSIPHKSYYCNQSEFGSVDEYERHVVVHYPGLPGYPGPADIELYGLKKRGMSWERHKSKHGMEIVNHGQKSDKLRFYKAIIVTTRDSKSIWSKHYQRGRHLPNMMSCKSQSNKYAYR